MMPNKAAKMRKQNKLKLNKKWLKKVELLTNIRSG